VIVTVPQARVSQLKSDQHLQIEFPSLPAAQRFVKPKKMTVLPLSDASTHTVQVRFDLPADVQAVNPGLFARVNFALQAETNETKSASAQFPRIGSPTRPQSPNPSPTAAPTYQFSSRAAGIANGASGIGKRWASSSRPWNRTNARFTTSSASATPTSNETTPS